jgi:hypothetical protein
VFSQPNLGKWFKSWLRSIRKPFEQSHEQFLILLLIVVGVPIFGWAYRRHLEVKAALLSRFPDCSASNKKN